MKNKDIKNKKHAIKDTKSNRNKHDTISHDDSSKIVTINNQFSSQNFINVKKIKRIIIIIIIIFI